MILNQNVLSGVAGAMMLNLVHQLMKKVNKDAPHVDEIGKEAVSKSVKSLGYDPPRGKKLFATTLVGDILANSIYYGLIGKGRRENLLLRGVVYGTVAGVGALTLTKPLGLDDRPVNRSTKTKLMTVGLYVLGGVVTVFAHKLINSSHRA